MILMLAPAPNMPFGGAPSGATYVSDQFSQIRIANDSTADQEFLAAAGCYTLSPFGGWGTFTFNLLTDLYAADAASSLVLPGLVGFPPHTTCTVQADGANNGLWYKTGTGAGAGNWTQTSATISPDANAVLAGSSASQAAISATLAAASANAVGSYGNAYASVLPQGVSNIAISNGGSGGTNGTGYAGGVSGGPAGFAWTYDIVGGVATNPKVTNPGLSTASTAPTLTLPNGGLSGSPAATATVSGNIIVPPGKNYWTPSSDSKSLVLWTNNGTGTPVALLNPDGSQISMAGNAALAAILTSLSSSTAVVFGRPSAATLVTGSPGGGNLYTPNTQVQVANGNIVVEYWALTLTPVKLVRQTISGTTSTAVASYTYTPTSTGYNTFTLSATAFPTAIGDYLGLVGNGALAFTTGSDPIYFVAGATGGAIGSLQTAYAFQFRITVTTSAQTVTASAFATLQSTVSSYALAIAGLALLSASVPLVAGRPTSATLLTGSPSGGALYTPNVQQVGPGTILVEYWALTLTPVKLVRQTFSGSTSTVVATYTYTPTATGYNSFTLSATAFPVAAGDYLGLVGNGALAYTAGSDPIYFVAGATGGAIGSLQTAYAFQFRITVTSSQQIVTAAAVQALQQQAAGGGTLNLANVDKIVHVGNSYCDGMVVIKGKTPAQLASALSEYNWGAYGFGGYSADMLATNVATGVAKNGYTLTQMRPKYAILQEQQNSKYTFSQTDPVYYANFQTLIDATKAIGVTPIVYTEWGGYGVAVLDGEQRNLRGLRALADANNELFIDGTSKSRTMSATGVAYLFKGGHPTTRTAWLEIEALKRGAKQLPRPLRSMKIFRLRGTTSTSSTSNFLFRTLQERHLLWRELYLNQTVLSEGQRIFVDTLSAYNVGIQTITDEYMSLAAGNATALGTYALIDCVLPSLGATGVTVTLSDTTCTVYARKLTNSGESWVQLALTNGAFVVPDGAGLVDRDRLALLVYKSGGISLTASPIVSWTAGTPRLPALPAPYKAPSGTEMVAQPLTVVSGAVPGAWTNSGSLAPMTPFDGIFPNGTTGCVAVTPSAGLSQAIAYTTTDDPTEIVVRVWARYQPAQFVPAATTTASITSGNNQITVASASGMVVGQTIACPNVGSGMPDNATITAISGTTVTMSAVATATAAGVAVSSGDPTTASITYETADTASLQVTLSGASGIANASAVLKDQVGLHWMEIEFHSTLEALSTAVTVDVRSADNPIQIAKVSVRTA